jgi:hypothetical protein
MVRAASVALPILCGVVYFLFPQPVVLVLIGAVGQGLMLPFLAIAALYFHHYRLIGVLPSSSTWTVCLWVSALAMMAAGAYQLVQTLATQL